MRRPIASRNSNWAHATVAYLARKGFTPNFVSGLSIVFAAIAAACFFGTSRAPSPSVQAVLWFLAALSIQVRLLCNLFDGMLAVEHGKGSVVGPIYNDLPDRPADIFIIAGAGYALSSLSWMPVLGWIGAVLAVLTAYVRVLGTSLGAQENFAGPMAKPHRMAVLTGACLLSIIEVWVLHAHYIMTVALALIAVGCVLTVVNRLRSIVHDLERKADAR